MESRLSAAVLVAVIATYFFLGFMGMTDRENPNPRDAAYNLLARGLLSGHLYLDKDLPAGFQRLADPYDPVANKEFTGDAVYRLHDLSYYRGRLYLYFGVAPALLVFVPWHLVTGAWLPHWVAVILACTLGLLVNVSLLRSVRARQFPGTPSWIVAAATLVLGLASYAPVIVARADMWEVPIAFEYLFVSIALRCLWEAFCDPDRAGKWLAAASVALGLSVACRPNALPVAAMLLAPFFLPGVRRRPVAWLAAVAPIAACGVGIAAYNEARFGSPFEFGTRYVLQGVFRPGAVRPFGAGYFSTNVRLHLFQPVEWSGVFPFAHEPPDAVLGPNAAVVEHMSGVLVNAPILWAALVVPAFILIRRPPRSFVLLSLSAGWVVSFSLALFLFFSGANSRYQFEYAPALGLLAAIGLLALEDCQKRIMRLGARLIWVPALAISSAFPVLYGIDRCVLDHEKDGFDRVSRGDIAGAEREFDTARTLSPGNPLARRMVGVMFSARGQSSEALAVFETLVRDHPEYAMAQFDLAHQLLVGGNIDGAIEHYSAAHRLAPGDPAISAGLAAAVAARDRRPRE